MTVRWVPRKKEKNKDRYDRNSTEQPKNLLYFHNDTAGKSLT